MPSNRRKVSESVPGDEQGPYPRDRLMRMDERVSHAARTRNRERSTRSCASLAAPASHSQRSAFLQDVARRLHGVELGDGVVAQAAREAQAEIRKASPWLQA